MRGGLPLWNTALIFYGGFIYEAQPLCVKSLEGDLLRSVRNAMENGSAAYPERL